MHIHISELIIRTIGKLYNLSQTCHYLYHYQHLRDNIFVNIKGNLTLCCSSADDIAAITVLLINMFSELCVADDGGLHLQQSGWFSNLIKTHKEHTI